MLALLILSIFGGNSIYWLFFGISVVVFIVWAGIFDKFTLCDEEKAKDKLKKEKKESPEKLIARLNPLFTDAMVKEELEKIKREEKILCTETALEQIATLCYNEDKPDEELICPICGKVIELDTQSYCELNFRDVEEVVERVDETGKTKQECVKVKKLVEDSAICYTCPQCLWKKYTSKYGNSFYCGRIYKQVAYKIKDFGIDLSNLKFKKRTNVNNNTLNKV